MKKYTLVFIFLLIQKGLYSQCLPDTLFRLDSLGNKSDKLFYPMLIKILPDSIKFCSSTSPSNDFLTFAILEKKKCKWNNDFSKGFSEYQLESKSDDGKIKYPTLKIIYNDDLKRWIELLYNDSEERIFTISK